MSFILVPEEREEEYRPKKIWLKIGRPCDKGIYILWYIDKHGRPDRIENTNTLHMKNGDTVFVGVSPLENTQFCENCDEIIDMT